MGFPILVICEGASEVNYIQHLNRILCSAEGRSVFVPRDANGGAPKKDSQPLETRAEAQSGNDEVDFS